MPLFNLYSNLVEQLSFSTANLEIIKEQIC